MEEDFNNTPQKDQDTTLDIYLYNGHNPCIKDFESHSFKMRMMYMHLNLSH